MVLTCITGLSAITPIIKDIDAMVIETPLDQDVVQYDIYLDSPSLLQQLSKLQYQVVQVAIPLSEGELVDPNLSTKILNAKELLTVLISRILGANLSSVTDTIRENYLFLTPKVRGPNQEYLLYRSREVVQNFHSRVELFLNYQVVEPHPMAILAINLLGLEQQVVWLEDIPLTAVSTFPFLAVQNLTQTLLANGWLYTYSLSDTERKRQLLSIVGPTKVVKRGPIEVVFYQPDPHLLLSVNWIERVLLGAKRLGSEATQGVGEPGPKDTGEAKLTLIGPWMSPPISELFYVGGGIPPLNAIGTLSGRGMGATELETTVERKGEVEQWQAVRAKLMWSALQIRIQGRYAWIDPTLALVIPITPEWRKYLSFPITDPKLLSVRVVPTLEQGYNDRYYLYSRGISSLLVPSNFDIDSPEAPYYLVKNDIQVLGTTLEVPQQEFKLIRTKPQAEMGLEPSAIPAWNNP